MPSAQGDDVGRIREPVDIGSLSFDQQHIEIDRCVDQCLAQVGDHPLDATLSRERNQNRQFWPCHAASPMEGLPQISTGILSGAAFMGSAIKAHVAATAGSSGRFGESGPRAYTAICRDGQER